MATISSAGIGSGLDINGIISQLMAVERQPLASLDTKEASYQAKLSAFGSLKGSVSSLQSAALALKSTTLYAAMSAQSSNTSALTASANTAASSGTYAIQVVTKAQAQSISSQAFNDVTSDLSSVDGQITIEVGTSAVTIDVAATDSSLEEIRDKINAANAGVKANIVYVGGTPGYKLTLTATSSGAANSIKLTIKDAGGTAIPTGDLNNENLEQFSFDPALTAGQGNEFDVNVVAQDAHLKIDGLDVYRTTNLISDAITGVTLTAADVGTSTLTIGRDTTAAKNAFDSFVKAYNDANKQLRDFTAFNTETGKGSLLTGDSGARALQSALRNLITTARTTASGGLRSLSDLGISMQRDGSLAFDSSKLTTALSTSPADVSALMTTDSTTDKGLANRISADIENLLSSNGLLASRTEGINRSIEDIDDRRTVLERRLIQIEKRYRAQFTALDTLVASMQRTSQYLSQQLANLPSSSSSSS